MKFCRIYILHLFISAFYFHNVSSIIDPKINFTEQEPIKTTADKLLGSVKEYLSPHDMKRLEAYVDNLADFHLVSSHLMDTYLTLFLDDHPTDTFLVIKT